MLHRSLFVMLVVLSTKDTVKILIPNVTNTECKIWLFSLLCYRSCTLL